MSAKTAIIQVVKEWKVKEGRGSIGNWEALMEPNWGLKGAGHLLSFIAKRHRACVERWAKEEIEDLVGLVFKGVAYRCMDL